VRARASQGALEHSSWEDLGGLRRRKEPRKPLDPPGEDLENLRKPGKCGTSGGPLNTLRKLGEPLEYLENLGTMQEFGCARGPLKRRASPEGFGTAREETLANLENEEYETA